MNQTFEWDAANRLIAINYADTGNRTEFAYDGLSRRVKITEKTPGTSAVVQPASTNYTTFTTEPFVLPAGSYTLTFEGVNPNGGNNTALVDSVALNGTTVANGSFETPAITGYQFNPPVAPGILPALLALRTMEALYMSGNHNAPDGTQAGLIKNNGVITQTLTVSAGTYTLSFKAAQRAGTRQAFNSTFQQIRVTIQKPNASLALVKNFVWCGNQICEERDGSNSVTKRFFAEGEKRIGGSDAGNYFYSRDHLGSIREVTDSTGALKAQYDYDAWGNSFVVSGNMNVDFGYTGHYFHQPSGLNFTLNRIYNPPLARWMTRDPLDNAEMSQGANLYAYVGNNPINATDPLGLCPGDWWDPRTWLNEGLTDSLWDTGLSISDSLGGMAATPFYGDPAWQQVMNSATYSPLGQTENNPAAYNTVWASLIVSGVADSVAGGGLVAAGWEGMSPGQKFAIVNFIMRVTTGQGQRWTPLEPRPPTLPPFIGGP